jgi:hypothetical protein
MYTQPMIPWISTDEIQRVNITIEGPCGNSTLQSTSTSQQLECMPIPTVADDQVIVDERYSNIDGAFGTVRQSMIRRDMFVSLLIY